uniref:BHLH domain-containing protein n=1 Tax=Globodera pallida TaxID=36090 RepID=A0A183CEE6_GLOPA
MENCDQFLLGQYANNAEDTKCWPTAWASSASSSSLGRADDFFDENLLKLSSTRTKKIRWHRNSTDDNSSRSPTIIRPKRKKSTEKERLRNLQIKYSLRTLTTLLPGVKTEIPRIRTLRLANRYIAHLGRILRGEHVFCEQSQAWRLLTIEDFERTVGEEMQTSNSYKERAELELLSSCSASSTTTTTTAEVTSPDGDVDTAAHFVAHRPVAALSDQRAKNSSKIDPFISR